MGDMYDLKFLRSIKTGKGLIRLIVNLRQHRRDSKDKGAKRIALKKSERLLVFDKTGGRCHMCGKQVDKDDFHADHVEPHISGGKHVLSNYLPSCSTCNVLRWHYSSEEMQVIIKLGRWLKTKLLEESEESLSLANQFVKHDMSLRKRRKKK